MKLKKRKVLVFVLSFVCIFILNNLSFAEEVDELSLPNIDSAAAISVELSTRKNYL